MTKRGDICTNQCVVCWSYMVAVDKNLCICPFGHGKMETIISIKKEDDHNVDL